MKALLAIAATATLFVAGTASAQVRDSRGVVVESMPATPPEGTNQVPTVPPGAQVTYTPAQSVFATRPATSEYPACAPGQTDRCTQTYEGNRRGTRARRGRR